MESKKEIVLGLSKTLFWDVDPYSVDINKHAKYIIDRVISRGSWEEFKIILAHYGKEKVGEYATQFRYMDKINLAFCVTYFNMPKEKFRCFSQRHLHPTHWNY
ncbi:MAG: hypothetical protein NTX03_04030 [Bacteroidetes bacterium]|nr:hypothetical protein [Bacteroidota bacterium]